MKCFYHNDMDGKCAGAIVHRYYNGQGDYRSIDYNQDFPFGDIKENEEVVIVDFSLQKEGGFEKLFNITKNVIWIDHHKTAIEKHKFNFPVGGIRRNGISGCELTWEYFYNSEPPKVVKLLGDYDIWAFKYGDASKALQFGIRLNDTNPQSENWKHWLDREFNIQNMINDGFLVMRYKINSNESQVRAWGRYAKFEGYKAITCNQGATNSQLFDSVDSTTYDIMMPYVFDGKQWTIYIYSTNPDIDVSELAKKYGGGGHKGAAGFQCKQLPLRFIETKD